MYYIQYSSKIEYRKSSKRNKMYRAKNNQYYSIETSYAYGNACIYKFTEGKNYF